jgi:xanthine dehydrogenase iron-sulfur cluster and FAD-binding subunit A
LKNEIAPIDDIRSTKEYRTLVATQVLRGFLEGLRENM